jgi:hypothetical protein
VADDGLADRLSLRDFGVVGLEEVERNVPTGELEGEVGGGVVCGRGANVMQKRGEEEGFWAALPRGKVLCYDGAACGSGC